MKIQFDDPLFEAWTQRPLLNIAEAGAEIGEIKATAARIPEGDRDAWYREWTATADRLYAQAGDCAARGARVSARCLYQRRRATTATLIRCCSAGRSIPASSPAMPARPRLLPAPPPCSIRRSRRRPFHSGASACPVGSIPAARARARF